MARRKSFSEGIDAIFSDAGRPEAITTEEAPEAIVKPAPVEQRTTVVLDEALFERAKAVAFWERKKFKDLFSEALEAFLAGKEAAHGDGYVEAALESYHKTGK